MRSEKPQKHLDFSPLRTDETVRASFESEIKSALRPASTPAAAAELYSNLRTAVHSAASKTLPFRKPVPIRKRNVSERTRTLYEERQRRYEFMDDDQRKSINRDITNSCREDYREYVNHMIGEIEAAERVGNQREVTRITKLLTARNNVSNVMPSRDLRGDPITSSDQLLDAWNEFLTKKFATPLSDLHRAREHTVSNEEYLSDKELDKALFAMKPGKSTGWDEIPAEVYQNC